MKFKNLEYCYFVLNFETQGICMFHVSRLFGIIAGSNILGTNNTIKLLVYVFLSASLINFAVYNLYC